MKVFAVKTYTPYRGTDIYEYIAAETLAIAEDVAASMAIENGMMFYGAEDGYAEEYEQECGYSIEYVCELPESGEFPPECPSEYVV